MSRVSMESAVCKTHVRVWGRDERNRIYDILQPSGSLALQRVPGWPKDDTKLVTATEEGTDVQNQNKGRA